MFVGGNSTRMTELAKTEPNPDLRRLAIRNLGLMGSKGTGDALVEIYSTDKDVTVRKAVIQALFLQNNAVALVSLARKESGHDDEKRDRSAPVATCTRRSPPTTCWSCCK